MQQWDTLNNSWDIRRNAKKVMTIYFSFYVKNKCIVIKTTRNLTRGLCGAGLIAVGLVRSCSDFGARCVSVNMQ